MPGFKLNYPKIVWNIITFRLSIKTIRRVLKTVDVLSRVIHLKPIKFHEFRLLTHDNLKDCIMMFNKYTNGPHIVPDQIFGVLRTMSQIIARTYSDVNANNLIGVLLKTNSPEFKVVRTIMESLSKIGANNG